MEEAFVVVSNFLKRYKDTERNKSMTRTQASGNGRARKSDDKRIKAICYNDLEGGPRSFLMHRSPDPKILDEKDIENFWRLDVFFQFPELEESICDTQTMRRLMKSAVTERRSHQKKVRASCLTGQGSNKRRHSLPSAVSF